MGYYDFTTKVQRITECDSNKCECRETQPKTGCFKVEPNNPPSLFPNSTGMSKPTQKDFVPISTSSSSFDKTFLDAVMDSAASVFKEYMSTGTSKQPTVKETSAKFFDYLIQETDKQYKKTSSTATESPKESSSSKQSEKSCCNSTGTTTKFGMSSGSYTDLITLLRTIATTDWNSLKSTPKKDCSSSIPTTEPKVSSTTESTSTESTSQPLAVNVVEPTETKEEKESVVFHNGC
jgi:hypothetical protein